MSQTLYDNWVDYYELFNLSFGAIDQEQLHKTYILMSKEYHPDLHPDAETNYYYEQQTLINEGYRILSNPKLKAEYDKLYKTNMGLEPESLEINSLDEFLEYLNTFDKNINRIINRMSLLLNRVNNETITEIEYLKIKNKILESLYSELDKAYASISLTEKYPEESLTPTIYAYINKIIQIIKSVPENLSKAHYKAKYDQTQILIEELETNINTCFQEKGENNTKYWALREEVILQKGVLLNHKYMLKNISKNQDSLSIKECSIIAKIKETEYILKEMIKEYQRISNNINFTEQNNYLQTYSHLIKEYETSLINLYLELASVKAQKASENYLETHSSNNELEKEINILNSNILAMEIKCQTYEKLELLDNPEYINLRQELIMAKGSLSYLTYLVEHSEELGTAQEKAEEVKRNTIKTELELAIQNTTNEELIMVYTSLYNINGLQSQMRV